LTPLERIESWFESQGWKPLAFQREVWQAQLDGKSGLLHSSTGSGKTYGVWMAFVAKASPRKGLKALWITPLRALANDTVEALQRPIADFGLNWRVELRTGDSTSTEKRKQLEHQPDGLVTTPETLSLMLSLPDSKKLLSGIELIIVDEWHELMGTKRGTQTELCLARLRKWNPGVQVWGLSATLGNMPHAAEVLGVETLIRGETEKEVVIDSLLPETVERFPWAGHMGTQMLPKVIEALEQAETALVFLNTRGQAEVWFQLIANAKPEWADCIAIHHGSLDREERTRVEDGLKNGSLRAVVCTSTLDLGVDFSPVDRVLQIGSPKGVARLLQRAGRSGHRPGFASRVTIVPTHALELIDIASIRQAVRENTIEARKALNAPLDVLVQHLVTLAIGGGFLPEKALAEVRTAHSYRNLSQSDFDWALDFITRGGQCLRAYPEFHKVVKNVRGEYIVDSRQTALRHRMAIGTIVSETAMNVQFLSGGRLGTVEEGFISRLRRGDTFIFAGRMLEFVQVKEMTAYVKRASKVRGNVVRWDGGRMPLSSELAASVRARLEEAHYGELIEPEVQHAAELLSLQNRWSALPNQNQLLIERLSSREGHHLFIYPIEGRLVHEGLAALLAFRLAKEQPITFTMAANDYGFELLAAEPFDFDQYVARQVFSVENLLEDLAGSLNAAELARRQFREIARIAGLVFQGYPGSPKSAKQLQSSSGLFYDVFAQYEPENPLLRQASVEVMERQLEESRLVAALKRIEESELLITEPEKPTPFAFPLLVDRLRATVTSEATEDRIRRMLESLEKSADA
jgi:ATP-dependent Lhr-like helicase